MDHSKTIIEHVSKVLGVELSELNMESGVGDVPEWDSLAHTRLILSIEETFKITIDIEDAIEIETIGDIVELLQDQIG